MLTQTAVHWLSSEEVGAEFGAEQYKAIIKIRTEVSEGEPV